MMKKGLLITLPRSDEITEYTSAFSKPIVDECKKKNIKVKQLNHKEATKDVFEKSLSKLDYNFIVFNGHGKEDVITGYNNQPIIELSKNENILTDRITYARSCWAALGIGASCMKHNKEGCFIGYSLPFMFLSEPSRSANPLKDNVAKIFFDTSNLVPLEIINECSAYDSHEKSKNSMLKVINKLIKKGDEESMVIAETLWNNYMAQTIIGNYDARI